MDMSIAKGLRYKSRYEMYSELSPRVLAEWRTYFILTNDRPDAVSRSLAAFAGGVYEMLGGKADNYNPQAIAPTLDLQVGNSRNPKKSVEEDVDHDKVAQQALHAMKLLGA